MSCLHSADSALHAGPTAQHPPAYVIVLALARRRLGKVLYEGQSWT